MSPKDFIWLCRKITELALAEDGARHVVDPEAHAYWARQYHTIADEILSRTGHDPRPTE